MTALAVVYRVYDADDRLLYVGQTQDVRARMSGHRYQPWVSRAAWIAATDEMPRLDALIEEARVIDDEGPEFPSPSRGANAYNLARLILGQMSVADDARLRDALRPWERDAPRHNWRDDLPGLVHAPVPMADLREAISRLRVPSGRAS